MNIHKSLGRFRSIRIVHILSLSLYFLNQGNAADAQSTTENCEEIAYCVALIRNTKPLVEIMREQGFGISYEVVKDFEIMWKKTALLRLFKCEQDAEYFEYVYETMWDELTSRFDRELMTDVVVELSEKSVDCYARMPIYK